MASTTPLHAVQHIRKMRGGAQSHLMRASDSCYYIVKFQNNPQHLRVLANEYLATRIGLFLGLTMPQVGMIQVSGRVEDWRRCSVDSAYPLAPRFLWECLTSPIVSPVSSPRHLKPSMPIS
ncbi:MAG TPA: hypothetical protein VKY85_25960, partial [Candidatus Angelobacter sp.]|nr:hypothetical protein [Candidatus Angelobacter sp.]